MVDPTQIVTRCLGGKGKGDGAGCSECDVKKGHLHCSKCKHCPKGCPKCQHCGKW